MVCFPFFFFRKKKKNWNYFDFIVLFQLDSPSVGSTDGICCWPHPDLLRFLQPGISWRAAPSLSLLDSIYWLLPRLIRGGGAVNLSISAFSMTPSFRRSALAIIVRDGIVPTCSALHLSPLGLSTFFPHPHRMAFTDISFSFSKGFFSSSKSLDPSLAIIGSLLQHKCVVFSPPEVLTLSACSLSNVSRSPSYCTPALGSDAFSYTLLLSTSDLDSRALILAACASILSWSRDSPITRLARWRLYPEANFSERRLMSAAAARRSDRLYANFYEN